MLPTAIGSAPSFGDVGGRYPIQNAAVLEMVAWRTGVPLGPMSAGRTYAGLTPAERRAARREALLDAGLERFGTDGLTATTIDDLCTTARVGRQAFYEHFASREELLGVVFGRVIAEILSRVDEVLAPLPLDDVPRRGRAAMGEILDVLLGDPRKGRIATAETLAVPELGPLGRQVVHALADRLTAEANLLAGHGLIGDRDHSVLALAAVGGIREVVVDQLRADPPAPVDRIADDLAAMLVALGSA